ncbi:hypothetical protein MRX96_016121 [Rhipicephalus microplus]
MNTHTFGYPSARQPSQHLPQVAPPGGARRTASSRRGSDRSYDASPIVLRVVKQSHLGGPSFPRATYYSPPRLGRRPVSRPRSLAPTECEIGWRRPSIVCAFL